MLKLALASALTTRGLLAEVGVGTRLHFTLLACPSLPIETTCIMATQETPKAKRRKSLAGQGPLKDTARSTLCVEEEEWNGRELVLIQLPPNVCHCINVHRNVYNRVGHLYRRCWFDFGSTFEVQYFCSQTSQGKVVQPTLYLVLAGALAPSYNSVLCVCGMPYSQWGVGNYS